MTESRLWNDVDDYFTALLAPPDDALDAALRDSDAAGLPHINVAPTQGKLLHLLALIQGARRILEIGTLGGYSTIWLGRALPADGRLITPRVRLEARGGRPPQPRAGRPRQDHRGAGGRRPGLAAETGRRAAETPLRSTWSSSTRTR